MAAVSRQYSGLIYVGAQTIGSWAFWQSGLADTVP